MRTALSVFPLIVLSGLLLACGGDPSETTAASRTTAAAAVSRTPIAEIDAGDLRHAYNTVLSAERQYGGKAVLLTGNVLASQKMKAGPVVRVGSGADDTSGREMVHCYFRHPDDAARFKPNETIFVIGICKGVNEFSAVDLVECEVVKDLLKARKLIKPPAGK